MIVPTRRVEAGLEETPAPRRAPGGDAGLGVPARRFQPGCLGLRGGISRSCLLHMHSVRGTGTEGQVRRARRAHMLRIVLVPRLGPPRPCLSLDDTFLCHAVERIVSLCNHMFGDAQSALADYVQSSLMLRANKRFHLLRAERAPIFLGPCLCMSLCGLTSSLCVLGLVKFYVAHNLCTAAICSTRA